MGEPMKRLAFLLLAVSVAVACGSRRPATSTPGSGLATPTVLTDTPFEVAPRIQNPEEFRRALRREYPPLLRDAGIGGTVTLWLFIEENGEVQEVSMRGSSGHRALDDDALRVAGIMKFTPATNGGEPVRVWVSYPIIFWTRR